MCVSIIQFSSSQIEVLNKHLFITSKPVIYLVNLAEKDFIKKKNKWYALKFHNVYALRKLPMPECWIAGSAN
jgi:ribosome-binding ATPase YchF (GTP1/OBG family)